MREPPGVVLGRWRVHPAASRTSPRPSCLRCAACPTSPSANALGGVLGQTAFLAVADLTDRRANLEHAAASLPNLAQGVLLVILLGVVAVRA